MAALTNRCGPPAYQWWKNGVGLADATNASLTLTNVGRAEAGSYRVAVSNAVGGVVSSNATLSVLVPQRLRPPQRLVDGSIRLEFGPEDGFALTLRDTPNLVVQVSPNLLVWTNLTNGLVLTGDRVRIDDPESTNLVRRFYRVIENEPPPGP